MGCTPTGPEDRACFEMFAKSFGRRAFRRPLTADEVRDNAALAPGLSLGQAGVSQQMPRQDARNAAASNAARASFGVDSPNDVAVPQVQRITSALLDTWA